MRMRTKAMSDAMFDVGGIVIVMVLAIATSIYCFFFSD